MRFRDNVRGNREFLQGRLFEEIEKRITHELNPSRMLPYVQRYEFEALLFSDAGVFGAMPGVSRESVQLLQNIRHQYATPEYINDHSETSPSKRILQVIPSYQKVVNGPLQAGKIGLAV